MEGLKVKVRHVDGRTEELTVESDQVLIGSGAHCEVRLPADQARSEHVVVRATHAGLFAAARAIDPPPTLNGAAFTEAPMLAGAVLRINQSAIEISPVEVFAERGTAEKKAKAKSQRPAMLLAAALVAAVALLLINPPETGDSSVEPQDVPSLFSDQSVECPQKSPSQAKALAESKLSAANTKRERGPFYAEDGVGAVLLYELASACFRVAGANEDAVEATQASKRLKARVADEFRTHRMRFQYALGAKDWKLAQEEVHTLRAYMSTTDGDGAAEHQEKSGDYATWLSNWERRIKLTHGGEK